MDRAGIDAYFNNLQKSVGAGSSVLPASYYADMFANNKGGVSYQELLGRAQGVLGNNNINPAKGGDINKYNAQYGATANVGGGGAPVDPYAALGGRAAVDASKASIYNNFNIGADKTALQYGQGVRDLVQGYQTNQDNLNREGSQNDLAKIQGTQGVLGMVNRGIASGRSQLANKNASDSSAAGAIANAYGKVGQGELSKVNNQYALTGEDIGRKQATLEQQMTNQFNDVRANKEVTVNEMVNKTKDAISALNAQLASASIPDKIAIEQETVRLKNELLGRLQQYDQQLATAQTTIKSNTPEARRAEALRMSQAGVSAANPFQFTEEAPIQAQAGPSVGNLPLYTYNRNKQRV